MNREELLTQLTLPYNKQLAHLKNSHGKVSSDYFLTESCSTRNKAIVKVDEGLFIHHDYEFDPNNKYSQDLSKPANAKMFPYKYQRAENLTYCNLLEHLLLHTKINAMRKTQHHQVIVDAVIVHFIPMLNDMYNHRYTGPDYMTKAFDLIKDNYEEYELIIKRWLRVIGEEDFDWKSLSNCII